MYMKANVSMTPPSTLQDSGPPIVGSDPFYESQENHTLIGVANVFLACLFHDVKLDYHVPIISQQGEVGLLYSFFVGALAAITKFIEIPFLI